MDEILKKFGFKAGKDNSLGIRLTLAACPVKEDSCSIQAARVALDKQSVFQPSSREDLEPKPEDYIYPVYRALSQAVIENYSPVDYSKPGVLEASAPLLIGQTVYTNHDAEPDNWIGAVEDAWWDDPQQSETPFSAPGINVRLKIDWKVNPKIARGILMDPPALHSVSVSIWFDWEKSHPELSDKQFWGMLGETAADGRRVMIVATEILGYDEISLVYQGADPEAKIVGNEKNLAEISNSLTLSNGGKHMEEMLKKLQALLGKDSPESALELALERLKAFPPQEVLDLAKQIEEADLQIKDIPDLLQAGRAYREKLAKDIGRYATLALTEENGELSEAFISAHCQGDVAQLETNRDTYRKLAEKKFPLTCQDCGSTNVAGRSSIETRREKQEKSSKKQSEMDVSRIHG